MSLPAASVVGPKRIPPQEISEAVKESRDRARLGAVAHSSALISATVRPRAASRNAPPDPGVYRYKVVIQVGDTVYNTQLETSDPSDAEFSPGSEVQSQVSKSILYLKRTSGDVVEASIVGKKKAKANWLKACY